MFNFVSPSPSKESGAQMGLRNIDREIYKGSSAWLWLDGEAVRGGGDSSRAGGWEWGLYFWVLISLMGVYCGTTSRCPSDPFLSPFLDLFHSPSHSLFQRFPKSSKWKNQDLHIDLDFIVYFLFF